MHVAVKLRRLAARANVLLEKIEDRGLNRSYVEQAADWGIEADDRSPREKALDLLSEKARGLIRRGRALHCVLADRFQGELGGDDLEARLYLAAYMAKAVLCLVLLPEGGMHGYGLTAGSFGFHKTYGGWEAEFVSVSEGWRHWAFEIYNDGDSSL